MFYNVKIIRNGDIPLSYVALMDHSVSNATLLINSNIIGILLDTVKQISKQIH